jgi:bifunctional non-homologous end joining protein LigD
MPQAGAQGSGAQDHGGRLYRAPGCRRTFPHDVRLFSRNRLEKDLPDVAAAIAALPVRDAILDGEMTWGHRGAAYHVFDVTWLDGRDVTGLPLTERRALLDTLPLHGPLRRVVAINETEPWEKARVEGWEGVIAKRRDSPYEHKRSKHWLKMKCELSQDFVIGGFTDPQGKLNLRARLDASGIDLPPFTKATGLPRVRAHWVKPTITVHVAFIEWTVHRKLRHSRLLAVRDGSL